MNYFKTLFVIFYALFFTANSHGKNCLIIFENNKKNIVNIIADTSISHKNIVLYDSQRNRNIPIDIYSHVAKSKNLPIVIINHGYGIKNTEYSFIAHALAAYGYGVISIQHDLEGDPDLPKTGNIYQARMPLWERSVKNLKFVIDHIKEFNTELNTRQFILIGHSNGGDISMMFAEKYPEKVAKIISLDSLRYPFPVAKKIPILYFRATDLIKDRTSVIKENHVKIIDIHHSKHADMCDRGPNEIKIKIVDHILQYLTVTD